MGFDIRPLFRGSRMLFWGIVPLGTLMLLSLHLTVPPWEISKGMLVLYWVDAWFITLAIGLWDPVRFRWSLRIFAGIFLAACCAYVIASIRTGENIFRSLAALAVFGYPSCQFMLRGSFSWTPQYEDWEDLVVNARDNTILREPLADVVESDRDPDLNRGLRALVSAELLASMRGASTELLPERLKDWPAKHQHFWTAELAMLARQAVDRIETGSVLRAMWESEGELPAFQEKMRTLRNGLG